MSLGVIDIGYNAIRAVAYEDDSIGAPEIFNNKFKNNILNLLSSDNLDIKHQTYLSLQYILHIFNKLKVKRINCVATAVLRDHPRAQDFVDFIKNKYNFDIEVISGEREAILTAKGLLLGINHSRGIAADLGGGSLELVEIAEGKIGKLQSLDLGTKVLIQHNLVDINKIANFIVDKYGNKTYDNLYLIGGALRFICRFFIDFTQYPIKNLHNLEISSHNFLDYLKKIRSLNINKNKLGKRKINNNALLIAEAMIKVFNPNKIIVSTYGLKEGVRSELTKQNNQQTNILIEKVKYLSRYDESGTDFKKYLELITPLLVERPDTEIILKIAIMIFSLNKYFDQTLSRQALVEDILSSEIPFTHRMRIMLALILSYLSNYKPDNNLLKISKKLINKEDHSNSQIIGHVLKIAREVDGPVFSTPTFKIKVQDNFLEINSNEILPRPIFEKICERLKAIAIARKSIPIKAI